MVKSKKYVNACRLLMVMALSFIMRKIGHLIEEREHAHAILALCHNKLWPGIFFFIQGRRMAKISITTVTNTNDLWPRLSINCSMLSERMAAITIAKMNFIFFASIVVSLVFLRTYPYLSFIWQEWLQWVYYRSNIKPTGFIERISFSWHQHCNT